MGYFLIEINFNLNKKMLKSYFLLIIYILCYIVCDVAETVYIHYEKMNLDIILDYDKMFIGKKFNLLL